MKDTYHGLPVAKIFNREKYEQHSLYTNKRNANTEAYFLRSKGWKARIVPVSLPAGYKYAIYLKR